MKSIILYLFVFLCVFATGSSTVQVTTGDYAALPEITLSSEAIYENVKPGSVVGEIQLKNLVPEDGEAFIFANGSGSEDNKYFTIVGSFLNISITPDYEKKSQYKIKIKTIRKNGKVYSKNFLIKIRDLSETQKTHIDFEIPGEYVNTVGVWERTTHKKHHGEYSLTHKNLNHTEVTSCFEISHSQQKTGNLSFYLHLSSQSGGNTLQFYIDEQLQESWSGNVAWSIFITEDIPKGDHIYKWCHEKNASEAVGENSVYIDSIRLPSLEKDTIPPIIIRSNFGSGALLPGGNHTIAIEHFDESIGIAPQSGKLQLQRWEQDSWGEDMAQRHIKNHIPNIGLSEFTLEEIPYGKYLYTFSISDHLGNIATVSRVFYIDQPQFIIGDEIIDIGGNTPLSGMIAVKVLTVGAAFDITFSNTSKTQLKVLEGDGKYRGADFGYIKDTSEGSMKTITQNEHIASEEVLINTNGNRNIYEYQIGIGQLMDIYSGDIYTGELQFDINFQY